MTSTTPIPTTEQTISQIQIRAHIPVILDMGKMNYDNWRILFETHCHSFSILGHLDGTSTPTGPTDKTWHQIDGSIKMWIYGTISESLLSSVLKTQCTARELWENLENLFRDNKEARAIQLENELRSFTIGDLSVHDYCQKLKSISDLLTNVNSPISDRTLVMHLLNGLSSKFDSIINVIKHQKPPCSFSNARSMLILEEDRLKTKRRPEPSHTDNASSPQVLIATAPQHVDNRSSSTTPHYNSRGGRSYRGGRGGRNNRGGRGNQNWQSGNWNFGNQNPWAWPSQPQWPNNSPWPNQQQWPNTSPWPNQAWQHTGHQSRFSTATQPPFSSPGQGLLGHAPASAGSAYLSTTTTPSPANSEFIPTTLANAFNTMTLTDPSDAGWYMDTGATAHLTSQPGSSNSSTSHPM